MSAARSELGFRAAGVLGGAFVHALFATTRVERSGQEHYLRFREAGQPVIFVFWHGQLLPLLYHHRGQGAVVLVSEHADGEYVTRVLERMGFGTVRGSSTRGGSRGLRGMIRAAREGRDLAVTPDGPSGPARVFKPGALRAAALTGMPIIPVAASASSAWRLSSWDRFVLPRPFARLRLRYGAAHFVDRDADDEKLARQAQTLQRTLEELSQSVERGQAVEEWAAREANV